MQRMNSVTPVAVRDTVDACSPAISETRPEIEPVVRVAPHEDGVLEAEKRQRDRRLALLLMVLSGVFVIACIGGAWLVLNSR